MGCRGPLRPAVRAGDAAAGGRSAPPLPGHRARAGAAELVGAALEAFGADADLLAAERARIRLLLVDDAHHLDPQAARLVQVLAAGADLTLLAGDPNQAVYGFRGADPALLLAEDSPAVTLTRSHRCAPAVAGRSAASPRVCRRPRWRRLDGHADTDGSVGVRVAASEHAQAALIADTLRRAHLLDGVPWSQLAVIVRSVSAAAALPRAGAAGVPVATPSWDGPIADQPAAARCSPRFRPPHTASTAAGDRPAEPGRSGASTRYRCASFAALRRAVPGGSGPEFGDLLVEALTGRDPNCPPPWPDRSGGSAPCCGRPAPHTAVRATRATPSGRPGAHRAAAALAGRGRAGRLRRRRRRAEPGRGHRLVRPRRGLRRAHHRRVAAGPARPCRHPATAAGPPTTAPGPKRSRCSARTRRWAGLGAGGDRRPAGRSCGSNTTPRGGCWAPSGCSTCSAGWATRRPPGRRCWPRSAGC